MEGVLPYLDDIFVPGKYYEDHNSKLKLVSERLKIQVLNVKFGLIYWGIV